MVVQRILVGSVRLSTNRPTALAGAAPTHASPLHSSPVAGFSVTCVPAAAAGGANVSLSANGVTPAWFVLAWGRPTCIAGRTVAIAVARTVRPSRRTE